MTRLLQPWSTVAAVVLTCGLALSHSAPAQNRLSGANPLVEYKDSLTALPDTESLNVRGNVYVPTYSRVRTGGEQSIVHMATTLRIDNTSSNKPIVINRIDYFDTPGNLVQSYLDAPVALRPFGTIQISVPADDIRGGPAANFIVAWAGSGPIAEPLIEAVMFGTEGNSTYSFVSQGRAIRTVGKSRWFDFGRIR